MPTLNLGRVRFNLRGPYDPGTPYLEHDVVTDDGQSYACIADVTGTGPNDAGGVTYWEGMLLRGTDYNAARDQALQAASNAGDSATTAGQSAAAAIQAQSAARTARDKAQEWAESDTAPEAGSKSAKSWAQAAASYGDPNQHNVTANGTADTRTAAEWAGQTLSNQQKINGLGTASTANVGTGADDVPNISQADTRYAQLSGPNNFDTMPEVGGGPIVESDSNSDGAWTRWADGTQETGQSTLVSPGPLGVGTFDDPYRTSVIQRPFPVPFINTPQFATGVSGNTAGANACCGFSTPIVDATGFENAQIWGAVQESMRYSIIARGDWK
ncbi:hypothetical protein ACUN9Y_13275 [Halomonas sp. V046]|uniref:hypothetical protein n=1 Tax=Halomonas sp. V046 TaxID=3459611 RepID=UPI004044C589